LAGRLSKYSLKLLNNKDLKGMADGINKLKMMTAKNQDAPNQGTLFDTSIMTQQSSKRAIIKKSGVSQSLGAGGMELLMKLPMGEEDSMFEKTKEIDRIIQTKTSRYDEDYQLSGI